MIPVGIIETYIIYKYIYDTKSYTGMVQGSTDMGGTDWFLFYDTNIKGYAMVQRQQSNENYKEMRPTTIIIR